MGNCIPPSNPYDDRRPWNYCNASDAQPHNLSPDASAFCCSGNCDQILILGCQSEDTYAMGAMATGDPCKCQFHHYGGGSGSPIKIQSGDDWDPFNPKTNTDANVSWSSLTANYADSTAPNGTRNVKLFIVRHKDFALGPRNPLRIGFEMDSNGAETCDRVDMDGRHHVVKLRTGNKDCFQVFVHD
jgi:hypothetical protein